MKYEQRPEGREKAGFAGIWVKSIPERQFSICWRLGFSSKLAKSEEQQRNQCGCNRINKGKMAEERAQGQAGPITQGHGGHGGHGTELR